MPMARGTKGFRMKRINSSWGVREGRIDYILISKREKSNFPSCISMLEEHEHGGMKRCESVNHA